MTSIVKWKWNESHQDFCCYHHKKLLIQRKRVVLSKCTALIKIILNITFIQINSPSFRGTSPTFVHFIHFIFYFFRLWRLLERESNLSLTHLTPTSTPKRQNKPVSLSLSFFSTSATATYNSWVLYNTWTTSILGVNSVKNQEILSTTRGRHTTNTQTDSYRRVRLNFEMKYEVYVQLFFIFSIHSLHSFHK